MNVILTCDGRWESLGVTSLRSALIGAGFNVLTIVPNGSSAADADDDEAIGLRDALVLDDDAVNPVLEFGGSGAACVRFAILSGLAPQVDAIVCGISDRPGWGDGEPRSLSLDAALAGALLNIPSVSFAIAPEVAGSNEVAVHGVDHARQSAIAAEIVAWLAATPPAEVCALNVTLPRHAGRQLRLTTFEQLTAAEPGHPCGSVSAENRQSYPAMCLDAEAIAEGLISVTALRPSSRLDLAPASGLAWTQGIIEKIGPRLGGGGARCDQGCCG